MSLHPDSIWTAAQERLMIYVSHGGSLNTLETYTGATQATIVRWLQNENRATGARLTKLWHYLRAVGIQSPELETLEEYNRYLGELYLFGVIDEKSLLKILNVRNSQAMFIALRGGRPANPTYTLKNLKMMHDEALQERRQSLPMLDMTRSVPLPSQDPPVTENVVSSTTGIKLEVQTAEHVLGLVSELQRGVTTLRFLQSDMVDSDVRAAIIELSDLDEIIKLVEAIRSSGS